MKKSPILLNNSPVGLKDIWTDSNRRILIGDSPLQGIYCVYSMHWKPILASSHKEKLSEKSDDEVSNAA